MVVAVCENYYLDLILPDLPLPNLTLSEPLPTRYSTRTQPDPPNICKVKHVSKGLTFQVHGLVARGLIFAPRGILTLASFAPAPALPTATARCPHVRLRHIRA